MMTEGGFTPSCPCRKRRSHWSSGVLVLVDDASDPVASSDPEGFEVGYLRWKRFERSGAGQGHMRPVVVVVTLAGCQDPAEVGQVPDEGAVEKLTAASADPSLHDRVAPHRQLHPIRMIDTGLSG